jgi:hypothetical protein
MLIKGAMKGEAFLAYIEQCLAPISSANGHRRLDNVSFHKVASVEEAIEAVGQNCDTCRSIRRTSIQLNQCSIP